MIPSKFLSTIHYHVSEEDEGFRLDQILGRLEEIPSRAAVQRWIKDGMVKIDQNPVVSPRRKLRRGECVEVLIPAAVPLEILPVAGELNILHEDHDLIVLDKPAGLVVHPSHRHDQDTLVNRLLFHCEDLSGIGGKTRPGIVHRLDKDTSGVLVVAKNDFSHQFLAEQFRKHSVKRIYTVLVWGKPLRRKGTIDAPLGRHPVNRKQISIVKEGRQARTHWEMIRNYKFMSLLSCHLETGRTHQIRVHMNYIGLPVVCDPVYGATPQHQLKGLSDQMRYKLKEFSQQALHARELGFVHPRNNEKMEFNSSLPVDYQNLLDFLEHEMD